MKKALFLLALACHSTWATTPAFSTNEPEPPTNEEHSLKEKKPVQGPALPFIGVHPKNIELFKKKKAESDTGFSPAFATSFLMILAAEIGDKTFFIAALMAMKHPRTVVFLGAIGALALMTALSAGMGYTLPNLLPKYYTHYASGLLFFFFGFQLLKDASGMDGSDEGGELEEVEMELAELEEKEKSSKLGKAEDQTKEASAGFTDIIRAALGPIFVNVFVMTFLAEWGDRSQIATIALAAQKDPYGVTLGGIIGHSICTGAAVIGGKMVADNISERMVAIVGGVLFVLFGLHTFLTEP